MAKEYFEQQTIRLPDNFRQNDFLDFHRRDSEAVAERIDSDCLIKGLVLGDTPCQLQISFVPGYAQASLISATQPVTMEPDGLSKLAGHMLGLSQPIDQFERKYAREKTIGKLIRRNPGLRIPQAASAYEALVWAIIGQQISLTAAIAIRRRFIQSANVQTGSGLYCFPSSTIVAQMQPQQLKACGFSNAKIQALNGLNEWVQQQAILPETLKNDQAEQIRTELLAIKGIGPWTVNYALLRGFNWLDGSLHGDVAVRRNLHILLPDQQNIDARFTEQWLQQFSPWRALVAAHLWALQNVSGY